VLAAAGLDAADDPKSKGDAAAVVTAGAAAAPKANGEGAAVAAAGAAAGVLPKPKTLPVEAAFVTEGNTVVALLAALPKEKEAVVVWPDPKAGAGWPNTPVAGAFEPTVLDPKLKPAFEASVGFAPKVGAWVVVVGAAAAPPNWNREVAAAGGALVELAGAAPKENEGAEVVEGAPNDGGAVPAAPKAGVVVAAAPKVGTTAAAGVLLAAPNG